MGNLMTGTALLYSECNFKGSNQLLHTGVFRPSGSNILTKPFSIEVGPNTEVEIHSDSKMLGNVYNDSPHMYKAQCETQPEATFLNVKKITKEGFNNLFGCDGTGMSIISLLILIVIICIIAYFFYMNK
jgi:hypothetical protein